MWRNGLFYTKLRGFLSETFTELQQETLSGFIRPTVYNFDKIIALCKQFEKQFLHNMHDNTKLIFKIMAYEIKTKELQLRMKVTAMSQASWHQCVFGM